jgi:hypothetical protein
MLRYFLALAVLCGLTAFAFPDPIKKAPKVDHDKLAKECVEKYWKLVGEGEGDEVNKLCVTPFRSASGEKLTDLADFISQFNSLKGRPLGNVKKPLASLELSKFNEYLKKNDFEEIDEETIKSYRDYLGSDGRLVIYETYLPDSNEIYSTPKYKHSKHMLVRFKNGKALVTGYGSR